MGWLYRLFGRHDAAGTRPAPAPSPASRILGVKLIVESDVASLFGAALLLPPADLIDSIDQELAAGGRCARGEFKRHAADPGLGEPQVTGALTDDQRLALIRAAFPQARWACCGRVTDMCRYNVVVALRG